MKLRHFLILSLLALFLAGCAADEIDPGSMYPNMTESQLFHHGQNAMLDGQYDESTHYFETLDTRYPFGKYTQQAHLDMIYAYYNNDDLASALVAADRYIHLYPRGKNVDYAYYMRGLMKYDENHGVIETHFVDFSKRDLTSIKESFMDFSRLVQYFPQSKYAADAHQRMIRIRNMLARSELDAAQYYYEQKAYVAAANRATEIVRHYQESTAVPDALALMVKSYRALHLEKHANDALKVLQQNFPESKAARSVS